MSERANQPMHGSVLDRARRGWYLRLAPALRRWEWPMVGACGLIGLALIYHHYCSAGDESPLYSTLTALGLARPALADTKNAWQLGVARWLIAGFVIYTFARAWAVVFREQARALRLSLLRRHTIVCGLGDKGFYLAQAFRDEGRQVVVIDLNVDSGRALHCASRGIITLQGDATETSLLRRARVARARTVVAVCGSDAANAAIAGICAALVPAGRDSPMSCVAHIADLDLFDVLREREIAGVAHDRLRLQCFNVYESAARALLTSYPVTADLPHIVVVGLGRLGRSLVVGAARRWYADHGGNDPRLRITAVDDHAEEIVALLHKRFPATAKTCDVDAVTLDVSAVEPSEFEPLLGGRPTRVFVCLGNGTAALATALALRPAFAAAGATAVVRLDRESGFAAAFGIMDRDAGERGLKIFPLLRETCAVELLRRATNEAIAEAFHAEYVRTAGGATTAGSTPWIKPWPDLPEDIKEANRRAADDIGRKLRAIDCGVEPLRDWTTPPLRLSDEEVSRLSQLEHERWCAEKQAAGWRLGPRDDDNRRHPDLLPWHELSPAAREKDVSQIRHIPLVLARVGFRLVRQPRLETGG